MQLANKVDVAYAPEFPWIYFGHTILTFQFLLSTGADLNLQKKDLFSNYLSFVTGHFLLNIVKLFTKKL